MQRRQQQTFRHLITIQHTTHTQPEVQEPNNDLDDTIGPNCCQMLNIDLNCVNMTRIDLTLIQM